MQYECQNPECKSGNISDTFITTFSGIFLEVTEEIQDEDFDKGIYVPIEIVCSVCGCEMVATLKLHRIEQAIIKPGEESNILKMSQKATGLDFSDGKKPTEDT